MAKSTLNQRAARKAMSSKLLDSDPQIRAALVKRITNGIEQPNIPVIVLHQVAQCLEMWENG